MDPGTDLVIPLDSPALPLSLVGGKARAMAQLRAAGLPVPAGFVVSTRCYREFVEFHGIRALILEVLTETPWDDAESIALQASRIRARIESSEVPPSLQDSIRQAYTRLGAEAPAVAIRSSATAEDSPELSFAGQQDTYLNVRGDTSVVAAVRRCWASLWTARAMTYRAKHGVQQSFIAMGVLVQAMVPAEVSGVLFTANPSNGDRSELVINASFGLGEAIVGGHVTPDYYVLDRSELVLKQAVKGSKSKIIESAETQGTETRALPQESCDAWSIDTEKCRELARLGLSAEQLFGGVPQDIEWSIANQVCWLLQSRPITNLPASSRPDVGWEPPSKGTKLIRRQIVEHMPEPLSTLFADLYLREGLERAIDRLMVDFKMPFNFEDFMDRPMFLTVNGYAYCRASYRMTWKLALIIPKVLAWYVMSLRRLLRNVIPHWRDVGLPNYLATIDHWKSAELATVSEEDLLEGIRELAYADADYWFDVSIVVAAAKITDGMLNRFLRSRFVPGDLTSGDLLRGYSSQILQSQEDLEAIAQLVDSKQLRDLILRTPANDLMSLLQVQSVGTALRAEIALYLERYGHQIYNLDFVQRTQSEDPLPVLLSLKSLVEKKQFDTRSRQAKLSAERDAEIDAVLESLGPLRRWIFRKLLGWAQSFGPYREDAIFYMGAGWPTLRRLARQLGRRLADAEILREPDDIFYLETSELRAALFALQENDAWPELAPRARERRERREARKELHPPGMIPETSKFKFGPFDFSVFETQKRNTGDSRQLQGFAVSPGDVTAPASVILSPADFENMRPGTILVCPTTSPAWTPLFGQALGLVTDIGGILAHGSIVAREFGIPAVMGTGNATRRIASGQRIRVDGRSGTVTLLE